MFFFYGIRDHRELHVLTHSFPTLRSAVLLSLVPEIADVVAYGAGGKTLGASWGGPKISEGGSGERMVAVDFRSVLPGGAHLLFVGLHPQGFETPYGPDDRKDWVAVNKMYWNVLKVATTETAGSDGEKVTVQYGL